MSQRVRKEDEEETLQSAVGMLAKLMLAAFSMREAAGFPPGSDKVATASVRRQRPTSLSLQITAFTRLCISVLASGLLLCVAL